VNSAAVHYRRMAWLLAFGLVHAYLLWHGDILVVYALCGMLVYPLRRLSVRTLAYVGLALMAVAMIAALAGAVAWPSLSAAARTEWLEYWQPPASAIAEETAAFTGGWLVQESWRARYSVGFHLEDFLFFDLWRVGGLMLLGMALMKSGMLTGSMPRRRYRALTMGGLSGGTALVAWGLYQYDAVNWRVPDVLFVIPLWNYWGSVLMALGYIGLLLMLVNSEVMKGFISRLEAVGRTAFSCYILQTLICTTIFYGHGLGLFGTVDRTQQLLLTVAVWIVLLTLAPIWLRRFRFGPLEWLWRTLTYGRAV
jgi:uncharacterized protein